MPTSSFKGMGIWLGICAAQLILFILCFIHAVGTKCFGALKPDKKWIALRCRDPALSNFSLSLQLHSFFFHCGLIGPKIMEMLGCLKVCCVFIWFRVAPEEEGSDVLPPEAGALWTSYCGSSAEGEYTDPWKPALLQDLTWLNVTWPIWMLWCHRASPLALA